jgi:hypothetical protein
VGLRFGLGLTNGFSIWYYGVNGSSLDIPANYSGTRTGAHLFETGAPSQEEEAKAQILRPLGL